MVENVAGRAHAASGRGRVRVRLGGDAAVQRTFSDQWLRHLPTAIRRWCRGRWTTPPRRRRPVRRQPVPTRHRVHGLFVTGKEGTGHVLEPGSLGGRGFVTREADHDRHRSTISLRRDRPNLTGSRTGITDGQFVPNFRASGRRRSAATAALWRRSAIPPTIRTGAWSLTGAGEPTRRVRSRSASPTRSSHRSRTHRRP